MTLLDQIKTHARDDATFKALLELGDDDVAAMYGNERGYWGVRVTSRPLDRLQVGILAGPAVALPILESIDALSEATPVSDRTKTATFVLGALGIGKSLDFGDAMTRQRISEMQETSEDEGDGLPAAMIDALLSLGLSAVTVTADDVSAAMASVRINGTAQLQENWSAE